MCLYLREGTLLVMCYKNELDARPTLLKYVRSWWRTLSAILLSSYIEIENEFGKYK